MRFLCALLSLLLLCPLASLPLRAQEPGTVYLGVRMIDIDANSAGRLRLPDERGVQVMEVVDGSPADLAGIQPGDALLSYNGESILGSQQLIRLVRETPAGRKVRLQLWRNGKMQTISVKIGELDGPSAASSSPVRSAAIDVPAFSSPAMPDIPVMLLVWRSTLLGIECEGIDPPLAQYFGVKNGILVRAVEQGGPGQHAGLKAGDILVAIDQRPLESPRDLNAFHRAYRGSPKSIPLSVVRNRRTMDLSVAVPVSMPQ